MASVTKVLLVDDDEDDYLLTRALILEIKPGKFNLEWMSTYDAGLAEVQQGRHDAYLIDYRMGEHNGLEFLRTAGALGCQAPLILLTGQGDHEIDMEAMKAGAADYLIKGQITASMLERSIRYAIERHRMQTELQNLSLTDGLTGLHNRRGFLILAGQQLKLTRRTEEELLFVFADLDGMKQVNDKFGHQEGDAALIAAAKILKEAFRDSDIIARLGGDEFTVLALQSSKEFIAVLHDRLEKNLVAYNQQKNHPYSLSISIGIASYDKEYPCSVEEMLTQADTLMYADKRRKKASPA
jgi:diguanylate cyclase (GGDEF)-like protein